MREATRLVRATLTEAVAGTPLHPGPVFASTFHSPGEPAVSAYTYGRSHQPTWTALEHAIGSIEVAEGHEPAQVRVFGSGLAAVAAVFGATLQTGDTVVIAGNAYFGARQVLTEIYAPLGVTVRAVTTEAMRAGEGFAGAKLVWLETPSNPGLELTDIRRTADLAHRAGALLAVDNTTLTPMGQRPLECGADFSVCSDSKMMSGHSDLLLGHVAVLEPRLLQKVDQQRTLGGAIAGPMEAWLALRSLPTLLMRLTHSSKTAAWIAADLRFRLKVPEVRYPLLSLEYDRTVEIDKEQMRRECFGSVLCFTLKSKAAAETFFARSKLVTETTSFGGITTTAERRGRWGHDEIAPGFIRLSVGCEDATDLKVDIEQALEGLF